MVADLLVREAPKHLERQIGVAHEHGLVVGKAQAVQVPHGRAQVQAERGAHGLVRLFLREAQDLRLGRLAKATHLLGEAVAQREVGLGVARVRHVRALAVAPCDESHLLEAVQGEADRRAREPVLLRELALRGQEVARGHVVLNLVPQDVEQLVVQGLLSGQIHRAHLLGVAHYWYLPHTNSTRGRPRFAAGAARWRQVAHLPTQAVHPSQKWLLAATMLSTCSHGLDKGEQRVAQRDTAMRARSSRPRHAQLVLTFGTRVQGTASPWGQGAEKSLEA